MADSSKDGRAAAALALMFASGFAGLAYQIVWTQQGTLWLGHESSAVLAVVGAFFAGLAVGAGALGRRIEASTHPARWYALCELAIGLWGLALVALMAPAGRALLDLTGERPGALWQWSVAFAGTLLLLLPATAAMGATLPALERVLARAGASGGRVALLYAGNTLGAVAGVLAAAFWLVPAFGLARTTLACAALNLLCAATTPWLLRERHVAVVAAAPAAAPGVAPRGLASLLALTGLLGIGYEVLVVRVLRQVAENTIYTFAMLLAVYLVGTAAGAAAYRRWLAQRASSHAALGEGLLLALALACLVGTASLWLAEDLKGAVLRSAGPSLSAALGAEAALAAVAFLVPTVLMGALFSHLGTQAAQCGLGIGRALAVNTLGAAFAPFLFGLLIAPAWGPKAALLLVVAGYLALALRGHGGARLRWPVLATAGAAAALAALAPPLAFVDVPEGGRIVSYRDGALGAVSVVEDGTGVLRLRIDNRQQEGSSATGHADARQALLPLLLHPAPRQALFLGLGTGVTARAAAQDPQLQVEAVELLPEVIEASAHFADDDDAAPVPRLAVLAADARRYVRATPRRYDLVVSDNFHPARSGSAALYTVEHFRAVHERLAPGGVFCQWLPLHQLDLATLRSIVRAFIEVAPTSWAVLATHSLDTPVLGLVTRAGGGAFELAPLRARLGAAQAWPRPPAAFGIADDLALLGSFVAGPNALARLADGAPINTDDRPVVAWLAPRITYAPDSLPRERLFALLEQVDVAPQEILAAPPGDALWHERLAAYARARDRFLFAGRDVQPSDNVRRMLAQVREPLLEVVRISPDFRPAYDPLLQMAAALARSDADGARTLLAELNRLQPARAEARQAMALIDAKR